MKKHISATGRVAGAGTRGRRPSSSPAINRETILQTGFQLARTVPLQDVSMVRMANELGVTPANIRYHLNARDDLTAGIVILFYKHLLSNWPRETGEWRTDVSAIAELIYRSYIQYRGVAAYFAAGNRFQILAAAMRADSHTMALFMERYLTVMRLIGLDKGRITAYAVIMLQQMHMTAHATNSQQWPGEQKLLEKHLKSLDPVDFPSTTEMRESYLSMAGETAFQSALQLILSGLEHERATIAQTPSPRVQQNVPREKAEQRHVARRNSK